MCLIIFDWQKDENAKLTLVANRDEFFARPTRSAHFWDDHENILAGKDLEAGGTWLGVTREGRLCAVTNYREVPAQQGSKSRGEIPRSFLQSTETATMFAESLVAEKNRFSGYNALLFDGEQLVYCSNRFEHKYKILESGRYGLSNHLIDTPWPKVEKAKNKLASILDSSTHPTEASTPLLDAMQDSATALDDELPETGVGFETERLLSPIFIRSPAYGTRASTFVHAGNGEIMFIERTFKAPSDVSANAVKHYEEQSFRIQL